MTTIDPAQKSRFFARFAASRVFGAAAWAMAAAMPVPGFAQNDFKKFQDRWDEFARPERELPPLINNPESAPLPKTDRLPLPGNEKPAVKNTIAPPVAPKLPEYTKPVLKPADLKPPETPSELAKTLPSADVGAFKCEYNTRGGKKKSKEDIREAKEIFAGGLMDTSGKIIAGANIEEKRYPASITKVMTLHVVMDQVKAGKISLDDEITFSNRASNAAPVNLKRRFGIRAGSKMKLGEALMFLGVYSANDVAVAIAEYVAGVVFGLENATQGKFAELMNAKAREIKMFGTVYKNASGLPNPGQYTTARDQLLLMKAYYETYPEGHRYINKNGFESSIKMHAKKFKAGKKAKSKKSKHKNKKRQQMERAGKPTVARTANARFAYVPGHNNLIGRTFGEGIEGLMGKTGYIDASLGNMLYVLKKDGKIYFGVVFGMDGSAERINCITSTAIANLPRLKK